MKPNSKISVIIPTYNYDLFIKEAIDSVLNQNYPQELIEIIVVDDGSSDNTATVVKQYDAARVQYHYQENQGKAAATKKAIELASGDYIFNLDADDFFLDGKLDAYVRIWEQYPEITHIGSIARFYKKEDPTYNVLEPISTDIADKVLDGDFLLQYFYKHNILLGGGSTFAAKASVLKSTPFPDGVDMYTDEFLILVALAQGKAFIFSKPYSVWRDHSNNYSGKQQTKEDVQRKGGRLLKSSEVLLDFVRKSRLFDEKFVNQYNIIHENRIITQKENLGEKTFSDKIRFLKSFTGNRWPGMQMVKSYKFLNRFVPTKALHKIKSLKNK